MFDKARFDEALVDADDSAAIGGMKRSWWHSEVAAGRAPAPVVRRSRCTRWLLRDVLAFWRAFAADGHDAERSARLDARARKASEAARSKRRASTKPDKQGVGHASE